MNNFEKRILENNENNNEKTELTMDERNYVVDVWIGAVLGNKDIVKPEFQNDKDLKEWMNATLLAETDKICAEWGISPTEEEINQVTDEGDPAQKSKRELEYIQKCRNAVNNFIEQENSKRNGKWDSWPASMRPNRNFNCVGGALIGMSLLRKAGIKNYYGNPMGHVINIVELPNGTWQYLDFRNDVLVEINPQIDEIEGNTILNVNAKEFDYKIIPLIEDEDLAEPVMGNLAAMIKETNDDKIPEDDVAKREGLEILNGENMPDLSRIGQITHKLYPMRGKIYGSDEMSGERERQDIQKHVKWIGEVLKNSIIKELGSEEAIKLLKANYDEIVAFWEGADVVLDECLVSPMRVIRDYLEELKKENQEKARQVLKAIKEKLKK